MACARTGHYRPVQVRSAWLGLGLLLGLLGCGNTRRATPDEPCADDACGGSGQGGHGGAGGAGSAECEGADCPICVEGERFCQDGDVFACTRQGTSLNAVELCASGSICDPETVSCLPQICQVDAPACDGTRVGTCNAVGTQVLLGDVDCADEGQLCLVGRCVTCLPGQRHCLNDDIVTCDAEGRDYVVEQDCLPAYHCTLVPPGVATCLVDVCTPGQVACDLNAVKTCTEHGGWSEDFEQCAAHEQCMDASCVAEDCVPHTWRCIGNGVFECSEARVSEIPVQACALNEMCVDEPGPASCRAKSCVPGQRLCVDDQVGTCAPDGFGLVVEQDCRAAGQLCTVTACESQAVEQTGISTDCEAVKLGADTHVTVGNVFKVTVPRRLVELEVEMNLAEALELRWVVGSPLIDGVFSLSEIATTNDGPGSRFFSSGPLDVALNPGQTYMLGVSIAGDASVCFDSTPAPRVSFGVLFSSQRGDSATTQIYDPDRAFTFRLTTRP